MNYYDATPKPPRASSLVTAVKALLDAESDFAGSGVLNGSSNVLRRQPAESRPERFIVVRLRRDMGGRVQSLSRKTRPVVQVMTECDASLFAGDMQQIEDWHDYVHEKVWTTLVGQQPSADHATLTLPIERTAEPTAVMHAADTDTYYSTAEYAAVLEPA